MSFLNYSPAPRPAATISTSSSYGAINPWQRKTRRRSSMRAPTGRSRSGCGRWKPRNWRCTATRNGSPIRSPRLPARRTRSRWPGPRRTRWCCNFRRCGCGSFRAGNATQQPVVVCAPYALHGALIADFAPGHSLVEALQKDGVNRIYVPDWRSATPDMRYLSIDNYLADLNVAIDEIGAPVDLVGLCQGGWLSLVYAARFPGKVRRLVLAGAPVDISTPSELSKMVAALPQASFRADGAAGRRPRQRRAHAQVLEHSVQPA